ncbi:MAG: dethiobiotin synthetase [Halioglobus sp.]
MKNTGKAMKKSWFVTGTDTDVGKTAICCALLSAANERGLRTAAIKPVAAGCDSNGHNSDALELQAVMSERLDYAQVNPVALQRAIAPHIAAKLEGRNLKASQLEGICRGVMTGSAEFTLIEGAGGWRVPLNASETLADLASRLQVGVILVVGMKLGCINHALLTAEAIRSDGLPLAAWVANQVGPRMPQHDDNVETLKQLLPAPLLGDVPHIAPYSPHEAREYLSLEALMT